MVEPPFDAGAVKVIELVPTESPVGVPGLVYGVTATMFENVPLSVSL